MSDSPAEPRTAPRVAVCVPSHDMVPAGFANDLARMMAWSGVNLVAPGHLESVQLNMLVGTLIHLARQELVEVALRQDVDYVLWVDADMRFPADALHRLLSHRKPFVGANYPTRTIPPEWVATKKVTWGEGKPRVPCVTDEDATDLERVDAVGFGLALIRTDVFSALPIPRGENGPWFWFDYSAETDSPMGEDVYFCRLAREAGFQPFVDHDLSKQCSHIGSFEFRPEHVMALNEEADVSTD